MTKKKQRRPAIKKDEHGFRTEAGKRQNTIIHATLKRRRKGSSIVETGKQAYLVGEDGIVRLA